MTAQPSWTMAFRSRATGCTPFALSKAFLDRLAGLTALASLALLSAACGGGGGGGGSVAPPPPPPPMLPTLKLLAGSIGGFGNLDGKGSAARFWELGAIAVGSDGTLYAGDSGAIRRVTPAGNVSTMAGVVGVWGSDDGIGASAGFTRVTGVAVDGAGTVYVAEQHRIRKITADGAVSTLAGNAELTVSIDGTGAEAGFYGAQGLALDATRNLYVTDYQTIRKVTPQGVVTTLAGTQYIGDCAPIDGAGAAARFCFPAGIAVDSTGTIYVADAGSHLIRKLTADGIVTTFAGTPTVAGSADGIGGAASFNYPYGIAVDKTGMVYVADSHNHTIRTITAAGLVSTLAGVTGVDGSKDGTFDSAEFSYPIGLAVNGAGTVYVADGNNTVRRTTPDGNVETLAGAAIASGFSDGSRNSARFYARGSIYGVTSPAGIAVTNDGRVYVADTGNQTLRQIDPSGAVSTLAGSPRSAPIPGVNGCQFSDGPGSTAQFCNPQGVAVDRVGTVYVADTGNLVIRKVSPDGTVTTLAGSPGMWGRVDGAGSAARFSAPRGIAIDAVGTLYVSDYKTIRSVSPDGLVKTIAGSEPPPCDAPGTTCIDYCPAEDGVGPAALFCDPRNIAIDSDGTIYVTDRKAVRRVTLGGVVTTINGLEGAYEYFGFTGIAVDDKGLIYVADPTRHQILSLSSAGELTSVVGGDSVVGTALGPLPASLMSPSALAIGADGQLFIVDGGAILYTKDL